MPQGGASLQVARKVLRMHTDGEAVFHVEAMGGVASMLPGENTTHDAAIIALDIKPLPKGCHR